MTTYHTDVTFNLPAPSDVELMPVDRLRTFNSFCQVAAVTFDRDKFHAYARSIAEADALPEALWWRLWEWYLERETRRDEHATQQAALV